MKKRITETLLGLLAFVCCLPMMAQQHPEWQSQYAIGLNKLSLLYESERKMEISLGEESR